MPTVTLPIPINGYSDSLNHQHGAEGFSTSMLNVVPSDVWEHRRRIGTRQGFSAIADLGTSDDYNVQDLLTYEVYRDTDLKHEVLIMSGSSAPVAATATVTFTGNVTLNRTITITDTAGTTVVYTAKASTTVADNEFKRDGTVTEIADALELCIENSAGHNGTISASNVLGVLTLTQVSEGTGGNNTITFDLDNTTVSNFAGGDDNSGVFYADKNGDTHDVLYSVDAATATVTFTGAPAVDQTIIITDTAGTSKTYTMKSAENLASNEFATHFSTATVTITDVTELNNGDKVNLIATDTTSHDFTVGEVAGGGTWIAEVDNDTSATNLKLQIDANAKFSASVVGAVVTITQATAGTDGNTPITLTDSHTAGMSKTDFTTGVDDDVSSVATSLTACINHASGHGSTITAVATDKVVALTQDVLGTATSTGNTDITSTLSNATATNFSGAAYAAGEGRIQKYDTVRSVQFGSFAYLVTGRHYYKIDLSASVPKIEEWTNYNGSGGMPTDDDTNKCSLITRFGGRIVLSGLSSSRNNWFMSKIGDAEDWTPTALSSSDAQAGDSSTNFGKLGEPIIAMFPFGESGLMMAGRNSLTYLTADPVISGAQFVRMSNGVGVMGADAWCQGPEKTCYVASGDGIYLIQPNDFNIQRGKSVSTGRLDGFFAGVNPSEVDIHLAYDPPRATIFMYVNREADPSNVVHYQHHIPTQSWWTFTITDSRMDVIRATCLYTPISGEREGLWIGCKSGRISTQSNAGVFAYDGGAHVSPLKSMQQNEPNADNATRAAFTSRLAWSPINAGMTNERLLMTELDVLLDTHNLPETDGITKVGPTLTLYGAETAQVLSGLSGDILVTETQLAIDGGDAPTASTSTLDGGESDIYASCTLTVVDYSLIDATTDTFTLKDTTGASTTFIASATTTDDTHFHVQTNNTTTATNIETMLDRAANNEWVATRSGETVVIVQATGGSQGNQTNTTTADAAEMTITNFIGGQIAGASGGYPESPSVTIQLHDSSISNLNTETLILADLDSETTDVTLTFDSSIGVDASTATKIGCSDVDGSLLGIMRAIKKSIDINYDMGLLNIKTGDPADGTPSSSLYLRITDAWNGVDSLPAITGSAVSSSDIQSVQFTTPSGWKEFVTGGYAPDVTGTYTLDDVAASDSLRKWSRGNSYTVRRSGNVSVGTDPPQYEGTWGLFPKSGVDDNVPMYIADEPTATLALSTITSTEILPAGFTASTVIIDPQQDSTTKRELATFALNKGRNNRFRIRKRESDFQIQISASGTTWVLEDIAANIEQGGPYRSVVTA